MGRLGALRIDRYRYRWPSAEQVRSLDAVGHSVRQLRWRNDPNKSRAPHIGLRGRRHGLATVTVPAAETGANRESGQFAGPCAET